VHDGSKGISSGKNAIIFSVFFFCKNQSSPNNDVDRLIRVQVSFIPRQPNFYLDLAKLKGLNFYPCLVKAQ